jgi:hypothetical protein
MSHFPHRVFVLAADDSLIEVLITFPELRRATKKMDRALN